MINREVIEVNREEKLIVREILIEVNNNENIFYYISSKLDLDWDYLSGILDKLINGELGEE